jgi:hypothetical protein
MRRVGGMLSGLGLLVYACVVPDVELVHSFPGAGGSAAGVIAAGADGHGGRAAGGNPDGGNPAAGEGAGVPDLGGAGRTAGGAGGVELDGSAPSCAALAKTACRGESCCASPLVPSCSGCTEAMGVALSSAELRLDKFEVTVGRFRAFVSAFEGPPPPGAGVHPRVEGSGWQAAWDGNIAADAHELESDLELRPCKNLDVRTWTKTPGDSEK